MRITIKKGFISIFGICLFIRICLEFILIIIFNSDKLSWSQTFHKILWISGEMIFLMILLDQFSRIKSLHLIWKVVISVLVLGSIILTIADPIVVSLAGDHITPSLLAHFAGPQIFISDELWLPIRENALIIIPAVILLLSIIITLIIFIVIHYKNHRHFCLKTSAYFILLSIALFIYCHVSQGRFLQYPPEAIFIRNLYKLDRYEPDEADISKLQRFFHVKGNHNQAYPLITQITPKHHSKPHIVLFVIESLRASELLNFNPNGKIKMESFDKFANNGIVFPSFISNGYPSTEGFMSLTMGILPHAQERFVISHHGKHAPSISNTLKTLNYESYRIENLHDPEEEGYWAENKFSHQITYEEYGKFPSEKNMVDTLVNILKHANKPTFTWLKTRNPHYPYEISDDFNSRFYQVGTPEENYFESLKSIDLQLNRLYEYLVESELMDEVIVIITGDHSNVLNKVHSTTLPNNETVWTGAIISGDSVLIGAPRVDRRHCSQVDISRTILESVGYDGEWIGFGQNLLERNDSSFAIAVRPSGIRLDYQGYSYMVNRSNPKTYVSLPAFPYSEEKETFAPLSSTELLTLVDSWAWLMDENRICSQNL